jgi:hypothetical protein
MSDSFDDMSKALARGVSRRRALGIMGAAALGALFAGRGSDLALAANQTSDCNHYCDQYRHPDKQTCQDNCRECAGGVAAMCGTVCCGAGTNCVSPGICASGGTGSGTGGG